MAVVMAHPSFSSGNQEVRAYNPGLSKSKPMTECCGHSPQETDLGTSTLVMLYRQSHGLFATTLRAQSNKHSSSMSYGSGILGFRLRALCP